LFLFIKVLMSILVCAHNWNHKWLCETISALEKKWAWVMFLYVPVFLKSLSDCWVGLGTPAECLSHTSQACCEPFR